MDLEKRNRPQGRVLALASVFAVLLATHTSAAVLSVPQDFPTIQAAIDAAENGDVVQVSPGTYIEQINLLGKQIVVTSTDGPDVTIIDGNGEAGYVVSATSGENGDTVFSGFTVRNGNGGMRVHGSSTVIENCVFEANTISNNYGGGLAVFNGSPAILSCTFVGNYAIIGGGLYTEFSSAQVVDCDFFGNQAGYGGGAGFAGGAVEVRNANFENNSANSFGGGAYFNTGSPKVERSRFSGNSSLGGGAVYASSSSLRLLNNRITGNDGFAGGAVYIASGNAARLVNCLIDDNEGVYAGGVYLNSASPQIINCTIVSNRFGGIFTTYNSFPQVSNSVISGNGNDDIWVGVEVYGNGRTTLNYTLIGGVLLAAFEAGAGVLVDVDPVFADSDYRLGAGSPAIDAGNNNVVPPWVQTDLDGNPRFVDDPATPDTGIGTPPIVDLGAYEYQPPRTPRTHSYIIGGFKSFGS